MNSILTLFITEIFGTMIMMIIGFLTMYLLIIKFTKISKRLMIPIAWGSIVALMEWVILLFNINHLQFIQGYLNPAVAMTIFLSKGGIFDNGFNIAEIFNQTTFIFFWYIVLIIAIQISACVIGVLIGDLILSKNIKTFLEKSTSFETHTILSIHAPGGMEKWYISFSKDLLNTTFLLMFVMTLSEVCGRTLPNNLTQTVMMPIIIGLGIAIAGIITKGGLNNFAIDLGGRIAYQIVKPRLHKSERANWKGSWISPLGTMVPSIIIGLGFGFILTFI